MRHRLFALACLVLLAAAPAAPGADAARTLFTRALDQERTIRDESNDATLQDIRRLVASYERIVRKYPQSGFSDNALWQAANLALLASQRFGQESDHKAALRLLAQLTN